MKTHTAPISHSYQKLCAMTFFKKSYLRFCFKNFRCVMVTILGLLAGAVFGWAVGWRLGSACQYFFGPAYLPTFEQVRTWCYLPATFANYGACTGALAGLFMICLYSQHYLKECIIALYQKGRQHPLDDSNRTSQKNNERSDKMRKTNALCSTILLSFLLFGCLPSLRPLYTDDTVVFDEQLLGKWYDEDGGIWSFTKKDDTSYELRIVEDDSKQAFFEVHLVQLGQHRFIDLYPGDNMDLENTAEMYGFNLVPAHTFMKMEMNEPNLLVQWVCLNEVIDDDPNVLKHEEVDGDNVLITAQSEDLQRVVLEHLDKIVEDEGAGELRRCPPAFSSKNVIHDETLVGSWQERDNDLYLDIVAWDNGYDILVDHPDVHLPCKGTLYSFAGQNVLGLYMLPISDNEKKAGLDRIPDMLMLVDTTDSELRLYEIEWSSVDQYLNDASDPFFDDTSEPDCVFRKVDD